MSNNEALLRHLEREIRARNEAERISEKKINELYGVNRKLEDALSLQKNTIKKLKNRTRELEIQTTKTEDERHAKSTLQNILESSIEYSIIAIDLEGIIFVWNEGAHRNYGYKAKEMVEKKNFHILHTPEDIQSGAVKQLMDKTYKEGKAEGVFERVRKDGTHFIASVTVSLLYDESGTAVGYVIISKDITESKHIEEQLIKSNQELEQFAYITSHDLKAPLRAIERLSSWIEEDNSDKLDDQSKKNLTLLRQRTKRMANLIDGILQYSRAGRIDLDIARVDTNELLQEIIDSLHPSKKFTIRLVGMLPTFKTAKIPLSQVFSNLLTNSIKHHHRKNGTIEIGVNDIGRFYEFYVADDGPGIEPEYFDKIFIIFQTLKSRDEFESTGVGLSIVKKIVESQDGKVTVDSTPGKGTTFSFTWPKYQRIHKR